MGNTVASFGDGTPFILRPEARDGGWVGRVRAITGTSEIRLSGEVNAEQRLGKCRLVGTRRAAIRLLTGFVRVHPPCSVRGRREPHLASRWGSFSREPASSTRRHSHFILPVSTMPPTGLEAVFLANRDKLVRFLTARGAGDAAEDLVQDCG